VNGKRFRSSRVDDDYSYYNDYEVMKAAAAAATGRRRRPHSAAGRGWRRTGPTGAAAQSIHAHLITPTLLTRLSALLQLLLLLIVSAGETPA